MVLLSLTRFPKNKMSIEILEQNNIKFIRKDGLTQSVIPNLEGGYWEKMIPEGINPKNICVLGLGAGTIVNLLLEKYPGILRISAIENNIEMIDLFGRIDMEEDEEVDERIRVFHDDAFHWMETFVSKNIYDLIIIDLFDGFNFDMHIITDKFLNECKDKLKQDGILVVNIPNLAQCEHHFDEAIRSDANSIYSYRKS